MSNFYQDNRVPIGLALTISLGCLIFMFFGGFPTVIYATLITFWAIAE